MLELKEAADKLARANIMRWYSHILRGLDEDVMIFINFFTFQNLNWAALLYTFVYPFSLVYPHFDFVYTRVYNIIYPVEWHCLNSLITIYKIFLVISFYSRILSSLARHSWSQLFARFASLTSAIASTRPNEARLFVASRVLEKLQATKSSVSFVWSVSFSRFLISWLLFRDHIFSCFR